MASQNNSATNTPTASDQGSHRVTHALMPPKIRAASEDFATRLMAAKLNELGTDLSNRKAVRDALRSVRFGEQLIENCADRAAIAAAR